MTTQRDLEMEFVSILQREFSYAKTEDIVDGVKKLIRVGRRRHNLLVEKCNRYLTVEEVKELEEESIVKRLKKINFENFDNNLAGFVIDWEPMGCSVKLVVPSGNTNDFAREGICVPGA